MGADISRVSFDEAQGYRLVVAQQGRVLDDADLTEAQRLLSEEQRREALDIVGPSGTPDNGYEVSVPTPPAEGQPKFDFKVSAGTYYVGGLRVELKSAISYSQQPDWLNPFPEPGKAAGMRECIVLHLREQEVSAIEDPALREVALGGPDTSQRTRILQLIERYPVSSDDCESAFAQVIKEQWNAQGLDFVAKTRQLVPRARLKVSFTEAVKPADRCQPEASGGYLGADNQLIRVQVAASDRLVWGFDNASFLYRVEVIDASTLRLRNRPVDATHRPRQTQTVEVLLATARLPNSTTVAGPGTHKADGAYIAGPVGELRSLVSDYDPDAQTVKLDQPLPPAYKTGDDLPPVFLRVWEADLPLADGKSVELGDTGLSVTPSKGPFSPGTFWTFAVRPFTPALVDPPRFLVAPQPPNGLRSWACSLAVLQWNENGTLRAFADCRDHFDNLVDLTRRKLGGCCTINVRVEDAQRDGLQAIIDRYRSKDEEVTICLMPGLYELPRPLRLTHEHSRLTLEGCHEKVVLAAAPGKETAFLDGLLVLVHADNVTLKGLRFHLPQVPIHKAGGKLAGVDTRASRTIGIRQNEELFASIAVRPVHCANLAVRDCLFRFSLTPNQPVFGVGIFAASECWGLSVQGCRFLHEEDYPRDPDGPFRFLVGYLLAPSLARPPAESPALLQKPTLLISLLHDALFEGNTFAGLAAAAVIFADIGTIRLTGNLIRETTGGFALLELGTLSADQKLAMLRVAPDELAQARALQSSLGTVFLDPLAIVLLLALSYPLPDGIDTRHFLPVGTPSPEELQQERVHAEQLLSRLLPPRPTGVAVAAETEQPVGEAVLPDRPGGPTAVERDRRRLVLQRLATFERLPWARSRRLERVPLSLHCAHNDVETSVRLKNRWALVVRGAGAEGETVLVTANRFRSSALDFPTVVVQIVERCTVTGNLIANEAPAQGDSQPQSLSLHASSGAHRFRMVAVTGNVFLGKAADLTRNDYPAPLNSWAPFNTQV